MFIHQLLVALSGTVSLAHAANSWIVPGTEWKSTANKPIDAHGGMVVQDGNTFYWIGQAVSDQIQPYLYSSKNLLDWEPSKTPMASTKFMWRPKLAKPNGSWWIYGQVNRNVQALKSSNSAINGNFANVGSPVTLPPSAYTYSDTGMFNEPGTDKWYLLTSADHNTIQINRINSDGKVGDRVNRLTKGALEAPGIVKIDGIYYLIVSGKTGYRNNPNQVFWTDKLEGGNWNGPSSIAPNSQDTYNSQNTHEFTVKGSKKTTYIYMGDSWVKGGGAGSGYMWSPMNIDSKNKKLTLDYHPQWKIDVATGEVSWPKKKRRYEAEDASVEGRAAIADCEHCLSKRGVHEISSDSAVTFHNVTGLGGPQWVQLHYRVADRDAGEAYVTVNDEISYNVSSLNSRAGYHDIVPVELNLREGAVNKITFGVDGRNAGRDAGIVLDGIEAIED